MLLMNCRWYILFFIYIYSSVFTSQANSTFSARNESTEINQFISKNFSLKSQNWGIHQDSMTGKVYFANSEGLYEFNGITFKLHRLSENRGVRSVYVSQQGTIFTGSFEDFGYWTENEQCELVYQSLSGKTNIAKNDEIWRIFQAGENIYFQSFTTIYIYNREHISMVKSPFAMLFIFPVHQTFIAQVIDQGLYWFQNNQFTFIPGSQIFNQTKVHSIISYDDNKALIATANHGLYLFNGKDFNYFNSEAAEFLKYYSCNTAHKANDSVFVFGTILNGLIISDRFGNIQMHYNKNNGLRNNTILALYKDMDNGLWIGMDDGTNYIELNSPYTHYTSSGGTLGTIYAILRDGNTIYLGTNHGLFQADIIETAGKYQFKNVRFIEGSQGQVWSLAKFDNQILCGHNEGTFLVKNNSLEKISDITGGWITRSFEQYLVQGTYTGITVFEKDEFNSWALRNRLKGFMEPVKYIEVDYLGYVWATHYQKGLYKIELAEGMDSIAGIEYFKNINGIESNLNVFEINKRIVFTNGDGIYTFDYVEKKIIPVRSLNNDLGEFSRSRKIIPYDKNLYWFIYENKLALFEISIDFKSEKKLEIIQRSEGLQVSDIHLLMIDDNSILIPTRECFDIYDIDLHRLQGDFSRFTLTKIIFYGKTQTKSYCYGKSEIRARWNNNNLIVNFSDPSMFSQEERIFQYRIPEVDERWNFTNSDNFTYLNLKHGNYTIEMKRGFLSDEIFTYYFTIKTPWYLTIYAIIAYILTLLILIYVSYRIFIFELNRQKELVQMEVSRDTLASELDHKSYELMLTIRYLIHKNEILTELQKEINDIKENSSKYPVKNLRNMEKIITEGLDTQTDDWKNTMNNLKLSQQGFFKKLLERFPDLTPNDLRLCSYLRMNFSTKEIARLLNNSPRAVEISRYRLRKKINLKHDVNLTEFLMSESFSDKDSEQG